MAIEQQSPTRRWYYKTKKTGHPVYNLKEPLSNILDNVDDYVEITKEEWEELTYVVSHIPTAEEIAEAEKNAEIAALKAELAATDYVVIKIAESDNEEEIAALRSTYTQVIDRRREIRARLNILLEE